MDELRRQREWKGVMRLEGNTERWRQWRKGVQLIDIYLYMMSKIQQYRPLRKYSNWKQQWCVHVENIQATPTHMACSPGLAWMVDAGMEVNPWFVHVKDAPLGEHVAPAPVKMAKEYKYCMKKARDSREKSRVEDSLTRCSGYKDLIPMGLCGGLGKT